MLLISVILICIHFIGQLTKPLAAIVDCYFVKVTWGLFVFFSKLAWFILINILFFSDRFISTRFQTIMAGEALSKNNSNQMEEFFESAYQQILSDISTNQSNMKQLNEVNAWLRKVIEYNLKKGKRNRAKSLSLAFDQFAPNSSNESMRSACMLGWCVELLQAYFLVVDDIMDNSITRRGQLCWYRKVWHTASAILLCG